MAVKVSQEVADQLEAVRESGEVNMLDRRGVQMVANSMDFYSLVIWCEDAGRDYGRAIFEGVEVVNDSESN